MKKFEWVEHPSDIGFRAYGRDLAEAFGNAALALFEVMVDTSKVEPREEISIELGTKDAGMLKSQEFLDETMGRNKGPYKFERVLEECYLIAESQNVAREVQPRPKVYLVKVQFFACLDQG